jgi:hypothetical protein
MSTIKTLIKEYNGTTLEAKIMKDSHEPYVIEYFINGKYTKTETFEEFSLQQVETAAKSWVNGIKLLNS